MPNPQPLAAPVPPVSVARPRRLSPLARDIVVVLVVKAIVLYGLWYAFFRAPAAPGMTMDPAVVEQRLFAPVRLAEPAHEP